MSRDGETGLTVTLRDTDALADAIAGLLADSARRRTYGDRARGRVEDHFARKRMLDTMDSRYGAIVQAKPIVIDEALTRGGL